MELVAYLIVGAVKLYLLLLVLFFVGAMMVQTYRDVKASMTDLINCIRKVYHEHRP